MLDRSTVSNKFQWNYNKYNEIVTDENGFEKVLWKKMF